MFCSTSRSAILPGFVQFCGSVSNGGFSTGLWFHGPEVRGSRSPAHLWLLGFWVGASHAPAVRPPAPALLTLFRFPHCIHSHNNPATLTPHLQDLVSFATALSSHFSRNWRSRLTNDIFLTTAFLLHPQDSEHPEHNRQHLASLL